MLFVLSVLAFTSIEGQFWTLIRSGQWFEIVERALQKKSGMTTSHFKVNVRLLFLFFCKAVERKVDFRILWGIQNNS